jgi:hypothetical protein
LHHQQAPEQSLLFCDIKSLVHLIMMAALFFRFFEVGSEPRSAAERRYIESQFKSLSGRLRQSDPRVTEFAGHSGYGRLLGEAIKDNVEVTYCALELKTLCKVEEIDEIAVPWCHFFRNSPALRTVHFYDDEEVTSQDPFSLRLPRHFLPALGQNQCVEEIAFAFGVMIPTNEFEELMRSTNSLKELNMDLSSIKETASVQRIGEAFGSNRTVERLILQSGDNDAEVVANVLSALSSHPALREFTFRIDAEPHHCSSQFEALASLFRSTTALTEFKLETSHQVGREHLDCFMHGLLLNSTITTLSFGDCSFDKEATRELVKYMPSLGNIRELKFTDVDQFEHHQFEIVVGRLLVDTSIRVLRFDTTERFNFFGLCQYMTAKATQIHLECLHLSSTHFVTDEFLTFIPALTNLQELSLPSLGWILSPYCLEAVRNSGSLLRVVVSVDEPLDPCPIDTFRLRAYCKRNEALDAMFTKRLASNSAVDNIVCPALLPSLFAVAKQAHKTSPSVIYAAVLKSTLELGASKDGKRLASP